MVIEVVGVALIVAFTIILMYTAHLRHVEKMEDKKIEYKKAETECKRLGEEETLANNVFVKRLMSMFNIEDWRWGHKHDECRAELFDVIRALLDNSGGKV